MPPVKSVRMTQLATLRRSRANSFGSFESSKSEAGAACSVGGA
jgi:hypothetical protein